jgi:hypothetical protein
MNGSKSLFVCALIALLETVFSTPANAQFAPGAAAKPAPKADPVAKEKSVLAEGQKRAKLEAAAPDFCRCVGEDDSTAVARIGQVLSASLHPTGLDYTDQPLQDVVTQVQDEYGIPIQLNKAALEEAGIGTDAPVTVTLHNISLRSALRLILKGLQLTYVIQDEVLLITTKADADAQLKVCVYDVRKIIGENAPLDPLVETIVSCVAKETWAKNGKGVAEIRPLKPGLLVITQTQALHEEIRNLLTTLTSMSHDRPQAAGARLPGGRQDEQVVTRSYMLQLNPAKDIDAMRNQVRDLITKSLPDETWNGTHEGQAVILEVFHDRVVLRHTNDVQEKVRKLLCDSGLAAHSPTPQPAPDLFGPAAPAATFAPSPADPASAAVPALVPVPAPTPVPAPGDLPVPAPAEQAPAAGVAPGPDADAENPFG